MNPSVSPPTELSSHKIMVLAGLALGIAFIFILNELSEFIQEVVLFKTLINIFSPPATELV